MAIKLSQKDQEFRNELIFHVDAKTIDLERTLLNLFMLIKHNGVPPRSRTGRRKVTPEFFVQRLLKIEEDGLAKGFEENKEPLLWWVMTNLLDLVNRGKPDKEAVASLKAIHLNSYKLRNPSHVRDYNLSDQIYAMLSEEPTLIEELKHFLNEGWNSNFNDLDANKFIDVDTLGILHIIKEEKDTPSADKQTKLSSCLCPGQARVFCDDVRRLLIYKSVIPRHVLLEYLRTLMGFHVGLYLFKLFMLLPDWVKRGERHSACQNCPVNAKDPQPFAKCPYQKEFVVDCDDSPTNQMGLLAEADATFFFARIHDYVRATFAINMALQFNESKKRNQGEVDLALKAIQTRGIEWDTHFKIRKNDLLNSMDEESRSSFDDILALKLPEFETFLELVSQVRSSFHLRYHRELLDSLFQKNKDNGLLWAGKSKYLGRRFWLSSRLLETLVQLAVLKENNESEASGYYSEPILIEDFLNTLQNRYGFIINGIQHPRFADAGIEFHQAFRQNVLNLKQRLREIGFFNVLSDAYIMQRIRPRYPIEKGQES
jgi:hypothetical protein